MRYFKLFPSLTVVVFTILFFVGCKRSKEDYIGPGKGFSSPDFAIVSAFKSNKDSVNFLKDTLNFSAKFNENVSYSITITGLESGAIKHLEGYSDEVHSAWDGSGELVFFKKGESCTAQLRVLGKEGVLASHSVFISTEYKPKGTVIANMEPGTKNGVFAISGFWETNAQIACGLTKDASPLEGNYAMVMEGIDLKSGGYIGQSSTKPIPGVNAFQTSPNSPYFYSTGTAISDSLWFTIFIYGTGQKHAQLFIKFDQDDDGLNGYDPTKENGFELPIQDLSHFGWKAFSFNYSSINLGGNTLFGGNGDGIHRTDKIVQIEYALNSNRPNIPVKVIFDYPVFTVGKPFGQ